MSLLNKISLLLLFLSLPLWALSQQSNVQNLIQIAEEATTAGNGIPQVLASWLLAYDAIEGQDSIFLPEIAMAIAQIYQAEELHEQALIYYLKALPFAKSEIPFDENTIQLYTLLGKSYSNLSKPDSAFYYYNHIVKNYKKTDDINGQITTMQAIVDLYSLNGLHRKALEQNLQLKEVLEANNRPEEELIRVYNNMGYHCNNLVNYNKSIDFFKKAMSKLKDDEFSERVIVGVNIGIAYYNMGMFDESIIYLKNARDIKKRYAPKELDEIDHLISTVYFRKKDFHNAKQYSEKAVTLAESKSNDALLVDIFYTTALIHSAVYEDANALEFFRKHLVLRDSFSLEEKIRQQQLLQQSIQLERAEKETKLLIINRDMQELTIAQLKAEADNQRLAFKNKEAELIAGEKEKEILAKENLIKASELEIQAGENQRAQQELELSRQRLLSSQKEKEVATLQQKEALQELEIQNQEAQIAAKQKEKDLILRDKELGDLELAKQNERVQFFYGLGVLMGLILLIIGGGLLYSNKLNQQLNQKNKAIEIQKAEITTERNKSDQLLLNILPEETARELKEKGFASPKSYENATVMFTDFSGFTRIASTMSPEQLIQELNYCFSSFDSILEKHGLEKIKTIGDAYMCVAGVPREDPEHCVTAIRAGQEIVAFMDQRILEKKEAGVDYWHMRMGLHSGPVVAGVVGAKKFAYDIWGDAVNIASRMESSGAEGRINISESSYQLVKHAFDCEPRGKILAKNVGEVNMYFVSEHR